MTQSETGAAQPRGDKVTIGLSDAGQQIMLKIVGDRKDLFSTEASAFKSVVSLAIRLGLAPSDSQPNTTKWNAGSLADLIEFVGWYMNTERPVRLVERLGEAGLQHVARSVDRGDNVLDIFEIKEDEYL